MWEFDRTVEKFEPMVINLGEDSDSEEDVDIEEGEIDLDMIELEVEVDLDEEVEDVGEGTSDLQVASEIEVVTSESIQEEGMVRSGKWKREASRVRQEELDRVDVDVRVEDWTKVKSIQHGKGMLDIRYVTLPQAGTGSVWRR